MAVGQLAVVAGAADVVAHGRQPADRGAAVARRNPGLQGRRLGEDAERTGQDTVLHALEDSGKIPAVARQGSGIAADYKLVMDMRRFEADYAGAAVPSATIEVNAKLLHAPDQDIVASHTFLQAVPAAGTDVASVAQAFDQALGTDRPRHGRLDPRQRRCA